MYSFATELNHLNYSYAEANYLNILQILVVFLPYIPGSRKVDNANHKQSAMIYIYMYMNISTVVIEF